MQDPSRHEMQDPSFKDCPYDVTLVAQGGKEFKAHRFVLSQASPFFDRLLSSDMKESREGVIHLKKFSESNIKDILDYIYTGRFQIWLHSAEELLAAADFLLLPDLEIFVRQSLARNLSPSNCLTTLDLAKRNHFKDLIEESNRFIQSNFAAVANSKRFMNLTIEEVEKWLTIGEVFSFIQDDISSILMRWVDHDKSGRRKDAFEEMFPLGIVACGGDKTFCYLPSKKHWYRLAASLKYADFQDPRQLLSVKGRLYNFSLKLFGSCFLRWSPWSCHDQWTSLKLPKKLIPEIVAMLGDDVFGVASGSIGLGVASGSIAQLKLICKYNLDSNSWETIHSSDVEINRGACMISHNKHLYFMGGMPASTEASRFDTKRKKWKKLSNMQQCRQNSFGVAKQRKIYIAGGKQRHDDLDVYLETCEVYDIATNEWQLIANLSVPRSGATMVCHLGTLFVLGGES